MTITPIEESALNMAPDGIYEVLRAGEPVRKVEDYYRATSDQWLLAEPLKLMARVSDPRPDGVVPIGVDSVVTRDDGKILIKTYLPEREQ